MGSNSSNNISTGFILCRSVDSNWNQLLYIYVDQLTVTEISYFILCRSLDSNWNRHFLHTYKRKGGRKKEKKLIHLTWDMVWDFTWFGCTWLKTWTRLACSVTWSVTYWFGLRHKWTLLWYETDAVVFISSVTKLVWWPSLSSAMARKLTSKGLETFASCILVSLRTTTDTAWDLNWTDLFLPVLPSFTIQDLSKAVALGKFWSSWWL